MKIDLQHYGLSERFEQEATLYDALFIARVTAQHRELYTVVCEDGELSASVSGKFAYNADDATGFPAVGDWVMIDRTDKNEGNAVIHHILQRKSALVRAAAGAGRGAPGTKTAGQMIAANIDIIFICMSLGADFNLRRVERYLTIAWDSMATPVIVLTKSDLCDDLQEKLDEIGTVSIGVDTLVCSSVSEDGYDTIRNYIEPGKTIAFIGSSGVGKSTLINRLIGRDVLATKSVREDDDKGRHTTTHRQLLLLPDSGIVIDTPGMRELQIHTGNISKTFEDVAELVACCKFSDCSHSSEAGCAVREAIESGMLSEERFDSYQKLQREVSYDGLNSRQIENKKLDEWFGSKNELKQFKRNLIKKPK